MCPGFSYRDFKLKVKILIWIRFVLMFFLFLFQFQEKLKSLIETLARINYANVIVNSPCAFKNICLAPIPRPCASPNKGCCKIFLWVLPLERACMTPTNTNIISPIITNIINHITTKIIVLSNSFR